MHRALSDAREFQFWFVSGLSDLMLARWRSRNGLRVFHRNGTPIGDFRKVWATACKNAGAPERLFHDLRCTAARAFRRAGVSVRIMRLSGWKTRDMFDRYNVLNQDDLRHTFERINGKQTANKPVEQEQVS